VRRRYLGVVDEDAAADAERARAAHPALTRWKG
jgi:branched-chain amino acid transport system ATP-binding protein